MHTTPDTPRDHQVGGVPAPLFRTEEQLAAGPVTVSTRDILIVSSPDGIRWEGGSADPTIARFHAAESTDDVEFNAAFTFTTSGTTAAWVTDQHGHRTTFTVTVTGR